MGKITFNFTNEMSHQEWLEARTEGIGGSDVACVLGLSPYKSSAEVFYEKVLRITDAVENEAMHWGNALEDLIADRWQYWAGSVESYLENYSQERVVRKVRRRNAIISNSDYPQLLANVDRMFNTADGNKAVLEIKTISGYVADQWENGIPPAYLCQLQTYLMVTEAKYGEVALLRDGRFLNVIPFEINNNLAQRIADETGAMWNNITKAREIIGEDVKLYTGSIAQFVEEDLDKAKAQEIKRLEPVADGSKAYEEYVKARYRNKPEKYQGSLVENELALAYNDLNYSIKILEDAKRYCSNNLRDKMEEFDTCILEMGSVTHKADKNGIKRFTVKIKDVAPSLAWESDRTNPYIIKSKEDSDGK